jgi:hypothetical protein
MGWKTLQSGGPAPCVLQAKFCYPLLAIVLVKSSLGGRNSMLFNFDSGNVISRLTPVTLGESNSNSRAKTRIKKLLYQTELEKRAGHWTFSDQLAE